MTTKLDYNRNSYNVVVRSELVSPFLTNVEMVVRPIHNHKLDTVAISNLNKTLIIKKLKAEVVYESVPINDINYERLIIKYVGNVLPEDIVNLEEVVKIHTLHYTHCCAYLLKQVLKYLYGLRQYSCYSTLSYTLTFSINQLHQW